MSRQIIALIAIPLAMAARESTQDFLTIDDGLSQNYVFDILQDSRGFLWFGTKEGLNRYDGYSVVAYRSDPYDTSSLSFNTVTALFEDGGGMLWVGTGGGGLNLFDRNTETFRRYAFSEDDPASLSHNHVLCISRGKNNGLWIGTQNGLNFLDKSSGTFRRYLFDPHDRNTLSSNTVIDVLEDQDTVWVSTTKGLCFFIPGRDSVVRISDGAYPEMQDRGTTSLFRDRKNRLLVGGRRGLFVFTGGKYAPLFTASESNNLFWISRVREDAAGNLLIATAKKIISLSPEHNRITVIDSLAQERLSRGLWIDRSNVVWVGTSGLGALTVRPRQRQFAKKPGNFLGDLFRREIDRVNAFLAQQRVPSTVDLNFRGANFYSAVEEGSDVVWFLTEHELFRIGRHDGTIRSYSPNRNSAMRNAPSLLSSMYRDRNNELWIATVGGVYRFSFADGSFDYHRLYPRSGPAPVEQMPSAMINSSTYADVTAMVMDQDDNLWCGTPELGLIRYDTQTGSIKRFSFDPTDRHSLSSNHILAIHEDPHLPDSVLWIGTEGGGLNRMNTVTERFSSLSTRDGLPNNVIYSILADDSMDFWMSTNNGLVRFDPKTYEMDRYDIQDGLQSNEFNRKEYYRSSDGTLYFGGIYGYNVFHPSTIVRNTVPPPVVITEFRLISSTRAGSDPPVALDRSITETDSITLQYADNMFSFQFAALDFNAPDKNRYAYRLEGFNDDWITANPSRIATYTNIDPGAYVFHVKASNSDGVWNDEGKKIALTILPPFWMTWWFRGILALVFISSGPTVYYFRVTQLKRERQRQQEISHLLIDSQEAERKRIAQEMHDSLGQELLVIKNRAVMGLKTAADESKEKRQLEQISDSATNVLKLVRTLSHNLRPPELDRLGVTESIRSILSAVREASETKVTAVVDEIDGLIHKEHEINLVRIMQESLNNIEKHSGADEIDVAIKVFRPKIIVTIRDNGKGFVPHEVTHGIGLAGISERVRILQGTHTIDTQPGIGTTITIIIPVNESDV